MNEIPIEFIPGFWVSLPIGLEGRGSGFLLAENIKSVFSVNCVVPKSQDFQRHWSILSMTADELNRQSYVDAIIRIISESWLESRSIIVVGSEESIRKILKNYLMIVGGVNQEAANKVILSKLGE